jgi:hypothetical protein
VRAWREDRIVSRDDLDDRNVGGDDDLSFAVFVRERKRSIFDAGLTVAAVLIFDRRFRHRALRLQMPGIMPFARAPHRLGKMCTSSALRVPSACGVDEHLTNVPTVMSARLFILFAPSLADELRAKAHSRYSQLDVRFYADVTFPP